MFMDKKETKLIPSHLSINGKSIQRQTEIGVGWIPPICQLSLNPNSPYSSFKVFENFLEYSYPFWNVNTKYNVVIMREMINVSSLFIKF